VSFPDFPGCITAGRTLEEAKDLALQALTGHIGAMLDTGESLPDPSAVDEVMRNPDFRDGIVFLVSIKPPEKRTA
jgi:predicted RNase H-like HicB family nuclease